MSRDAMSRASLLQPGRDASNAGMTETRLNDEVMAALDELGRSLAQLRLRTPDSVARVRESMRRHGQMTAVAAYRLGVPGLEVVDGFKRLQAARELGWGSVRVRLLEVAGSQAKVAMRALNAQSGLCELEEAWLVRSLYREDGLSQPEIGQLLGRHKSWVCRRLMLVELLDDVVQADVRLGLLSVRTAVALARLPRGNQQPAAAVVARRGLTTRQADQLCAALLAAPTDAERQSLLDAWASGEAGPGRRDRERVPLTSSPALRIAQDIRQLGRVAARLEARLLERPLASYGTDAATTLRRALAGLRPVLALLLEAVEHCDGDKENAP